MKIQTCTTVLTLLIALAGAQPAAAESPGAAPAANQGAGFTQEAYEKIKALQATLSIYRETSGSFPSAEIGLSALVASEKPGDPKFKKMKEALRSLPMDPWGRPYAYSAMENTMTLASKGPNPDATDDDVVVIETVALAGKPAPAVAQVKPVVALLRSVKESDTALFQQCWSRNVAERMGLNDESAKSILAGYQTNFAPIFGDYSLQDFSFGFIGTATVGSVSVKYKTREIPPLRVVKSGNVWKLGEE